MAIAPLVARPPYKKRDVPQKYERGWWQTELGNIQRAVPTAAIKRVNTLYTATAVDRNILCDCTLNVVVIALPAPSREQGLELVIKKIAGSLPVQIVGVVDGVTDPTLPNIYDAITVLSDGQQWLILNRYP